MNMKILNFVSNSTIKLVDTFKELSEEASEIDIAVAYVKHSGLELMRNYLVGKNVRIIFTFEFLVSDPECVKKLLEMNCECREYMVVDLMKSASIQSSIFSKEGTLSG